MRVRDLQIGEIVEVQSLLGFPLAPLYRVEGFEGSMIRLSCGTFGANIGVDQLRIVRRGLPEPESWLPSQIAQCKAMSCSCEKCRKLAIELEEAYSDWQKVRRATLAADSCANSAGAAPP